jgi:MFS transporter, ACS family, hexuronate transporter
MMSTKPKPAPDPNVAAPTGVVERIGRYRWVICALVFFATTVNYVDRQVLGILEPELRHIIGWDQVEYSRIVTAFQAAYALSLLTVGRLIDKIGVRTGYLLAFVFWSLAAMGHALVSTVLGFAVFRALLGFGEGGNFPAAVKTMAEWFPKKERALATGLFNAGTNVGAIIAPLMVPVIYITWGWRWAFIITGGVGLVWVVFWLRHYRAPHEHPKLSAAELAYIQSDPPDPPANIPWLKLMPHRQTWAFAIGKFMTDPIWWFYLFWVPAFLHDQYGLTITNFAAPLIVIYVIADVGSIGGGWLSSFFIKRGWTVNRGRKAAMLICALCVTPIVLTSQVSGKWQATLLIGLAAAAHQGWSANMFTLASDMFPRRAIGSVVGFGGMGGAIGGMFFATFVGYVLKWTNNNYMWPFIIAGSVYLLALLIIQLLVPRLKPADLTE